jgi:hypothetical protein
LPHDGDELLMDLAEHRFGVFLLIFVNRRERIEKAFVLARREESPLDPELVHQAGESETVHQYADRADDASLVDIDLVGGDCDVVAARRADVFDDRVQRDVRILGTQPFDLVVDVARLHGGPAGAVDAKDHALRALVLERFLQSAHDVVGARRAFRTDHSAQFDERGVLARRRVFLARPAERDEKQREEIHEKEDLEEDAPVTRAPLLLDRGHRDALERLALPVFLRRPFEISHLSPEPVHPQSCTVHPSIAADRQSGATRHAFRSNHSRSAPQSSTTASGSYARRSQASCAP